jgi:hypothetical protein
MRRTLLIVVLVASLNVIATPVAGAAPPGRPFPDSVPLPVDFAPEGIAVGTGSTFYVGSLTTGDIYRGDLRTGEGSVFIEAPPGRAAVGLKVDRAHHLLFVAGGATGAAYVYDMRSGAPVTTYQFAPSGTALLNDVIVTRTGAYFTDSFNPVLYKIPIETRGTLGPSATLTLSGPAATIVAGAPNLNGIEATPDGSALIVNHTALGELFTVDPATGASAAIAVDGLVPSTLDGLLLVGRSLWAVQNFANTLVRVSLSPDLSRGSITSVITNSLFRVPTTVARHGNRLALVNGRFDLGLPAPFGPGAPPGTEFDVVVVRAT